MKKLILLNLMLLLVSWSINAQTAILPSGDGSESNPYQIASLENLYWITANPTVWDKYFIQTANIDASATSEWATGWLPIGVYSEDLYNLFSGSYNGQGHTISGLDIADNSSYLAFGLFGAVNGATIQNLGVINIDINNVNGSAGAIAGYAEGVTINHCYSSGTISANNSGSYAFDAGGLVGYQFSNSTISDSYSSCDVSANNSAGGLVGYNYQSSVLNSYYVTGTVTGVGNYANTGGLIGRNHYYASIYKCYSAGNVIGYDQTGGLVGMNSDYSSVSNCYSRSNCTFNAVYPTYGGGLVGGNIAQSTITNCYSTGYMGTKGGGLTGDYISATVLNSFWDTQSSGTEWSYQGTGKTTAEMKTQSTFTDAGWDFATIWGINAGINDDYPYLLPASVCTNGTLALSSPGSNMLTVCANTGITLIVYTVGGSATGATISPTLPDGLSGTYDSVEKTFTIYGTPTAAGIFNYTVTTTGTASPCTEATATGTITVSAFPDAGIIKGSNEICVGGTATLKVEGDPGGSWNSSDESIVHMEGLGIVQGLKPGSANITYSVEGTGGCDEESDFAKFEITVKPLPDAGNIQGEHEICIGNSTTLTSDRDANGTWTSSNENVASVNQAGLVEGWDSGVTTITYTV
jgi:hypothetical protein